MNQTKTIQSTINYIKNELRNNYPEKEAESICYILLEHILDYSKIEIHLNKNKSIEQKYLNKIENGIAELRKGKPIQYVLGETEFYDLGFKVNQHTLIPRPETEELVHAIIQENKNKKIWILDVGTGSGCIPISLSKHLPQAKIFSADISSDALKLAVENSKRNKVEVHFFNRDILNWRNFKWEHFDLIVSNPPYVLESEKEKMDANVLNYEPHQALFVHDHDPLIFYRTIADFALVHLKNNGSLYFEINESLGKETKELLLEKGFVKVQIRKDINGKDRMAVAKKAKI